jgi:hypothetical protein
LKALNIIVLFLKVVGKKPLLNRCYELEVMKSSYSNESILYFMQLGCTALIDKDMMVLQTYTSGEMCPTSCDASQAINIKVEEVSDAKGIKVEVSDAKGIKVEEVEDAEEEESPVQITFPKIKDESVVRCMSLYVHCKTDLKKCQLSFWSSFECF